MIDGADVDDVELIDATDRRSAEDGAEVVVEPGWSTLALVAAVVVIVAVLLTLIDRGGGEEEATPPVVTERQAELRVEVTAGIEAGDGLVLGRETGLSLIVGGSNTPVRVLDLDTGDLVVSEIVLAPQFVAGSALIYISDTLSWARAPLDQFRSTEVDDADSVRFAPIGGPASVVPANDEQAWLTWPRTDGGREWQLIDLETSSVVREVTTPPQAWVPGGSDPFVGPEVVGSDAGGVFELVDDAVYERVLPGRLVAVADAEVLVRQCTSSLACEIAWFDRATWERTERLAPAADLVSGRLVAGDRLLAATMADPALGGGLYDMATGEIVRSLGPAPLSDATVSPDGAWLVRRLLGRIEVVEVATGTSTVVLNLSLGRGDSIVWIQSA